MGMTMILFMARAAINGAFLLTYTYTGEVYPTQFRATAFGFANSMSRVGGMVCPFVAVFLVESGQTVLAICLLMTACGFAGWCATQVTVQVQYSISTILLQ